MLSHDTKTILSLVVWSLARRRELNSVVLVGGAGITEQYFPLEGSTDFPRCVECTVEGLSERAFALVVSIHLDEAQGSLGKSVASIGRCIDERGIALFVIPEWSTSFPYGLETFCSVLSDEGLSVACLIDLAFESTPSATKNLTPMLLVVSRVNKDGIYFLRIPSAHLPHYLFGDSVFQRITNYIDTQVDPTDSLVRGEFSEVQVNAHKTYGEAVDRLEAAVKSLELSAVQNGFPTALKPLQNHVNSALIEVYRNDDLDSGFYRTPVAFRGFQHFDLYKRFMLSGGADYFAHAAPYQLRDIASVSLYEGGDDQIVTAIWLCLRGEPVASSSPPTSMVNTFAQITISDNRVSAAYLVEFFNSQFGRALLEMSRAEETGFTKITLEALEKLEIYVPDSAVQENIVNQTRHLRIVSDALDGIRSTLATNPISSEEAIEKLRRIHAAVIDLSDSERIRNAVRYGETIRLEFKQTFSMDIHSKERREEIAQSALKSVAGMLNQEGGQVLIGVSDDGKFLGVTDEIERHWRSSTDRFINGVKDKLKSKLGVSALTFVDMRIVYIDQVPVLCIDSKPSNCEVYYGDPPKFFARIGPSTEELQGPHLVKFCTRRFSLKG